MTEKPKSSSGFHGKLAMTAMRRSEIFCDATLEISLDLSGPQRFGAMVSILGPHRLM
jgi:hypothetical protein